MHYAEFAEDEVCLNQVGHHAQVTDAQQSQALLNAIKEYETNKWKVIGAKVGKPAKVRMYLDRRLANVLCGANAVLIGMRTICQGAFWKVM